MVILQKNKKTENNTVFDSFSAPKPGSTFVCRALALVYLLRKDAEQVQRILHLYDPLRGHCFRNLQEARNISACNIVAFHTVFLGRIIQIVENIYHNPL